VCPFASTVVVAVRAGDVAEVLVHVFVDDDHACVNVAPDGETPPLIFVTFVSDVTLSGSDAVDSATERANVVPNRGSGATAGCSASPSAATS
jgi:hypothetical protein